MSTESKVAIKRRPVFGILSIVTALIGGLVVNLLMWLVTDTNSYVRTHLVIYIALLTPICGVAFAIVTWIRGEPYRPLPIIGLLANVGYVVHFAQYLPGGC